MTQEEPRGHIYKRNNLKHNDTDLRMWDMKPSEAGSEFTWSKSCFCCAGLKAKKYQNGLQELADKIVELWWVVTAATSCIMGKSV